MSSSLPVIGQLFGTGVSAEGAYQQGQGGAEAANYNAAIAERNAGIAIQQGDAAAVQQQKVNYIMSGAVRAATGASGATGDSATDALMMTAAEGELARQNILYGAKVKSIGYTDQAAIEHIRARTASQGGMYSAAGKLLSGGAQAWSMLSGTGYAMPGLSGGAIMDAGITGAGESGGMLAMLEEAAPLAIAA